MPEKFHISSLVVHVLGSSIAATKSKIAGLPQAEIYAASDQGKLVVVLETDSAAAASDTIEQISHFPNVLNVALVYHQAEQVNNQ